MVLQDLVAIVGTDNCSNDPADQILHSYDHSPIIGNADMAVFPTSTDQVAEIIKIANKHKIPIITRGSATNTCGSCVPTSGGIVLSTLKLNKILSFHPKDRYAIVQPGVINGQLQNELSPHNMFWPPDPGSAKIATIGGNIACNAAGPSAVKYGVTRDHVLGLTFVTGSGNIIKSGVCTTKGVVGYDLTRLLIGSQGTLGIITEAVLKLSPKPQCTYTICATYNSLEAATEVITMLMQQEIAPSAVELLDSSCLKLLKNEQKLNLNPNSQALLIVEINGSVHSVNNDKDTIHSLIANHQQRLDVQVALNDQERQELWLARKLLSPKLKFIAPNKINEDVVVPISQLPNLISFVESLSAQYQIPIVNFGHAGNGNIHVNILINDKIKSQKHAADVCLEKIFDKVIALNGTLSGEHGIGLTKAKYIDLELNNSQRLLNSQLKAVFDPNNILNPQLGHSFF